MLVQLFDRYRTIVTAFIFRINFYFVTVNNQFFAPMKSLLIATAIVALTLASCAKEENESIGSSPGSWNLNRTPYSAYKVFRTDGAEKLLDAQTNNASAENLTVHFNELPTTSGSYAIKRFGFFNPPPGPGEISIVASGADKIYGTLNSPTVARVDMVSGKIHLSFFSTTMVDLQHGDTVLLSATLREK